MGFLFLKRELERKVADEQEVLAQGHRAVPNRMVGARARGSALGLRPYYDTS
jgi:hypothetical protein